MSAVVTVPLSKLVASPDNVRRANSEAGLDALATSIEKLGLLQNLNVKKKGSKYEVDAGSRRMAALRLLQREGRAAKGVPVDKDFPVNVVILSGESSVEVSLSENYHRSNMNAADEIEAFRILNEHEGMSPEVIADRFGISHMTVRRRLKLASLSPRIIEELREGRVSLDQAQMLALGSDHAVQEAAWFEVPAWRRSPDYLRQAMTEGKLAGSHRLARFVGRDAYVEAGGGTEQDLFASADTIYFNDSALLARLAMDRLESAAEELRLEGWKWVEPSLDRPSGIWNLKRLYPETAPIEVEMQEALDRLQTEADELSDQDEDFDWDSIEGVALSTRIASIEAELAALSERAETYSADQKARSGIYLFIESGGLATEKGLLRAEDMPSVEAGADEETTQGKHPEAAEVRGFSGALIEDLSATRTAAMRCELAARPDVALAAIIHPLAARTFFSSGYSYGPGSAVEVRGEWSDLGKHIKDGGSCRALVLWNGMHDIWKSRLPEEGADLWTWLLQQTPALLGELLAYLTAANLNAVQYGSESKASEKIVHADRVADAVELDMLSWWRPDQAFFARMSKATMAGIMLEAGLSRESAADLERLPKYEATVRAEAELSGTDWLPAIMKPQPLPCSDRGSEDGEPTD